MDAKNNKLQLKMLITLLVILISSWKTPADLETKQAIVETIACLDN